MTFVGHLPSDQLARAASASRAPFLVVPQSLQHLASSNASAPADEAVSHNKGASYHTETTSKRPGLQCVPEAFRK